MKEIDKAIYTICPDGHGKKGDKVRTIVVSMTAAMVHDAFNEGTEKTEELSDIMRKYYGEEAIEATMRMAFKMSLLVFDAGLNHSLDPKEVIRYLYRFANKTIDKYKNKEEIFAFEVKGHKIGFMVKK